MKSLPRTLAALLLAGCAANPDPIIDTKGVDLVKYERDLAECQVYREQIETGEGVVKGAAAGGAVGAGTGVFTGDVGRAAGVGAVLGGAKSAQLNEREKQRVVKNCLRGRGYRVLN